MLSKLQIALEDKVAVLIPSFKKLFSIKLVEELLGKIMCLWGNLIILGGVLIPETLKNVLVSTNVTLG